MRVLVTRPEPGLSRTAERLEATGFQALRLPLTRIVPLEEGLDEAAGASADIFIVTSAAAVRAAAGRIDHGRPLWTVGAATAAAARELGFATVEEGPGDGAGLAVGLAGVLAETGRKAVYLAGRVRSPDLEDHLAAAGVTFRVLPVYDTLPVDYDRAALDAICDDRPCDAVLLYSRAAATRFAGLVAETSHAGLAAATPFCLSDNVAAGLADWRGPEPLTAGAPTEDDLLELLAGWRNQAG